MTHPWTFQKCKLWKSRSLLQDLVIDIVSHSLALGLINIFLECFPLSFEHLLMCHSFLQDVLDFFIWRKFSLLKYDKNMCRLFFYVTLNFLSNTSFICILSSGHYHCETKGCFIVSVNLSIIHRTISCRRYHLLLKTFLNFRKTMWSNFLLYFQNTSHLFKSQHFSQVQNFSVGLSPFFFL